MKMPLLNESRFLEDLIAEVKNPNKKWECVGLAALLQFALGVTVAGLRNISVTVFPRSKCSLASSANGCTVNVNVILL